MDKRVLGDIAMKVILGFIVTFFLISQFSVAGEYGKTDMVDDAADEQGSVERFEQTLQESPTAAGLANMKETSDEPMDQSQQPMGNSEVVDILQEEPIEDSTE